MVYGCTHIGYARILHYKLYSSITNFIQYTASRLKNLLNAIPKLYPKRITRLIYMYYDEFHFLIGVESFA
jgi:hypothetical protein